MTGFIRSGLAPCPRFILDFLAQRDSVNILGDNEWPPVSSVVVATHIFNTVDLTYIDMIQSRRRSGLFQKALKISACDSRMIGQELQRNCTIEPGIEGLVDHTHSALSNFFEDVVMRNGLSGHRGHLNFFPATSVYLLISASSLVTEYFDFDLLSRAIFH